jgi:multiple sugar transport system permease protein
MGYASALSFVLFVIILIFSLVNARLTNARSRA